MRSGRGVWAWLRRPWRACPIREPFCGVSHFVGAVLSVVALLVLLVLARGQLQPMVGFAVYGASLILLYLASALSHSLHVSARAQEWLNRLDYIAIFLLIAGTYTPVCLIALRGGALGWGILSAVYGLALTGVVSTLVWKRMPHRVRLVLYVCMGCLVMALLPPLRAALPPAAIGWLLGGGIVYLAGMAVLALDRPSLWPGRNRAHDLWHVFVLGGSACHFVLMACFVAPAI